MIMRAFVLHLYICIRLELCIRLEFIILSTLLCKVCHKSVQLISMECGCVRVTLI